ncbi:MAG: hypothetical protein ACFB0E_21330 [Leptolyngbyaceae cyanobacterium]
MNKKRSGSADFNVRENSLGRLLLVSSKFIEAKALREAQLDGLYGDR